MLRLHTQAMSDALQWDEDAWSSIGGNLHSDSEHASTLVAKQGCAQLVICGVMETEPRGSDRVLSDRSAIMCVLVSWGCGGRVGT